MNEFCVLRKDEGKILFGNTSRDFTGSDKSTKIYIHEESNNDVELTFNNLDEIHGERELNEDIICVYGNSFKDEEEIISGKGEYNVEDKCGQFGILNFNQVNIKSMLRFMADCCSFLCAVGIWGILEDVLRILSDDDNYVKLYYYLIFTILFTSFTCTFNLYLSKRAQKSVYMCEDLECPA
ncbi:conserved Plasmodium protein, unknown function [Plasmodium knowlesi strain H]|uniref:Uncharacterized protein n=3 Tax=Plasmodium knowlesi TaxID=5850 RepID=A0A5K1VJK6_PLAKH|nr:conserved Plasmodium protein, unknown function [Plasmodium knowlesi strain H]OTN67006.1 Uncharacterized protein PKNOH_S07443200 [Plasmodium knowlesi]CAA9988559.1 conserved Plasmodium protein, unknown function [Plasmodium knowlesi strain H]SBO21354.1 conserved Plasmodium protein, unknown function [Plasmodium knowlesi strain H]SBO21809.1 conserved Plasmodium protein, unknown function [Plasmodium knowlesi strain H]VVS78033.1 conserved Plasmodium protein, unknown function [Plasmodium knowlesi s|eukprot:XP_002259535.1 hypothetical protein, conserved in Plasmodium species [Plasmodium knowlesi strain H]